MKYSQFVPACAKGLMFVLAMTTSLNSAQAKSSCLMGRNARGEGAIILATPVGKDIVKLERRRYTKYGEAGGVETLGIIDLNALKRLKRREYGKSIGTGAGDAALLMTAALGGYYIYGAAIAFAGGEALTLTPGLAFTSSTANVMGTVAGSGAVLGVRQDYMSGAAKLNPAHAWRRAAGIGYLADEKNASEEGADAMECYALEENIDDVSSRIKTFAQELPSSEAAELLPNEDELKDAGQRAPHLVTIPKADGTCGGDSTVRILN